MIRLSPHTSLLACLLLAAPPGGQNPSPWAAVYAIEGIDPVLLLEGSERQGKLEFHADHDGFRYLFVSEESRRRFLEDPARYAAQLGGVCARMGPGNPFCHHALAAGGPPGIVHPDIWAVAGGHIYMFWTLQCRDAFLKGPEKYLEPVPAYLATSDAGDRRGRALLDRAVAAAGGSERLDRVTTYVASSSRTIRSPMGDQQATATILWALPDRIRIEIEGGPVTFLAAATPEAGFVSSGVKGLGRFEERMAAGQRERYIQRVRYQTDPVGLLLARNLPGFHVTAVESEAGQQEDLAAIVVRIDTTALTLGIDSPSGQIRRMSFVDRNGEGLAGERIQTFDDYRTIDGISVPHRITGRFNGEPDPEWTWTITSIRFNTAIDPALFQARR